MTELMIGHRGDNANYPENTMISLENAVINGCKGIEFDLAISKDGIPFLMHDLTLDRTTNGTGACYERNWGYISNLDAGNGEKVPSFYDVIKKFKNQEVFLLIELKVGTAYSKLELPFKVAKIITDNQMENQCYVFSSNINFMNTIKNYNKSIVTGILAFNDLSIIKKAVENKHKFVSIQYEYLTQAIVEQAHKYNLKVNSWTLTYHNDIQKMIDIGVDWITSDYTERLKEIADLNNIIQLKPDIPSGYIKINYNTELVELPYYDKKSYCGIKTNEGIKYFKLVDIDDTNASKVRLNTTKGIKAIASR